LLDIAVEPRADGVVFSLDAERGAQLLDHREMSDLINALIMAREAHRRLSLSRVGIGTSESNYVGPV